MNCLLDANPPCRVGCNGNFNGGIKPVSRRRLYRVLFAFGISILKQVQDGLRDTLRNPPVISFAVYCFFPLILNLLQGKTTETEGIWPPRPRPTQNPAAGV